MTWPMVGMLRYFVNLVSRKKEDRSALPMENNVLFFTRDSLLCKFVPLMETDSSFLPSPFLMCILQHLVYVQHLALFKTKTTLVTFHLVNEFTVSFSQCFLVYACCMIYVLVIQKSFELKKNKSRFFLFMFVCEVITHCTCLNCSNKTVAVLHKENPHIPKQLSPTLLQLF